jgi:DNA (cytosine-5)-methyltransferase 1
MTLVDIFAGCGGGTLGLQQAGFRPISAVEVDPLAASAYERNIGLPPLTKDIRKVRARELAPAGVDVTLVFGCPPCQSFTVLRRGTEVTPEDRQRYQLLGEYLRMVAELRPRHVAFENVPGMRYARTSSRHPKRRPRTHPRLLRLLHQLHELKYATVWGVLDAADFGVPQHRKRVVVIGSRVAKPRLPLPTHGPDTGTPWRTVKDVIGGLTPLDSGEVDPSDSYHAARKHAPIVVERLEALGEGQARADLPESLRLRCHKDHDGHYDIYGRMWWDRPAPTLTSGCTNVTRGRFAHPDQARAITLREALLLQSFPDDAQLRGGHEAMALQIGNAVPPPLARAVGLVIAEMETASRASEDPR